MEMRIQQLLTLLFALFAIAMLARGKELCIIYIHMSFTVSNTYGLVTCNYNK